MKSPTLEDRVRVSQRPNDAVVMYQKWRDLLFLHWEVDPAAVASTLPDGLSVDLFEGRCFLGLVPFYMCDIRPRFLPTVPGISNFLEMNVRTYVHDAHGNPGVWFYSLDANQGLAVTLARKLFHLPYFRASMSAEKSEEGISYHCRRKEHLQEGSEFLYRGGDMLETPSPGSLEYFLLERYLLFSYDETKKRLLSGQVYHTPYPAQEAEVTTYSTTAFCQAGFDVGDSSPVHAAFSPGVSVKVFGIKPVAPQL